MKQTEIHPLDANQKDFKIKESECEMSFSVVKFSMRTICIVNCLFKLKVLADYKDGVT